MMKKFLCLMLIFVLSYPTNIVNAFMPLEDSTQPDIVNFYGSLIYNADNNDEQFQSVYSLYDFDKDGILELIIDNNEPHATRNINFYKFDNGLNYLGSYQPGYSELCQNPNGEGIITFHAYRNRQWLELLTYNNNNFETQVITEFKQVESASEYDEPHEIINGAYRLETCPTNNDELLKKFFGNPIKKEIKVLLNEKEIEFDQPPVMINDRVMVPIRAIFEAMGYTVNWNEYTQTAEAIKSSNKIIVQINNNIIQYTINGKLGTYECDVVPQIISERTLVPVRAIAESAGCDVQWDGENTTVIITYEENVNEECKNVTMRALLLAGYDNDQNAEIKKMQLDANRLSVDYVKEALNLLNVTDIKNHYMEDDQKNMSAIEFVDILQETFRNATDNDLSIIYYSGHTYTNHTTLFSGISFQNFYELIKKNVKGTVLLMYDGCYAGELMNLDNYDDRIKILAACDEEDQAFSAYLYYIDPNSEDTQICSIFAYAFNDGVINNKSYLDSNSDNSISLDELYIYLLNSVYNICDRITTKDATLYNKIRNDVGLRDLINIAQTVEVYPDNDTTPLFIIE